MGGKSSTTAQRSTPEAMISSSLSANAAGADKASPIAAAAIVILILMVAFFPVVD
jgi:hypothetical protein